MKFASDTIRAELDRAHPYVRSVAEDFDAFCQGNGMGPAIITDVERDADWYARNGLPPNPNSLHLRRPDGKVRAIDFRNRHLSDAQRALAEVYLRARCSPGSRYEVVVRTHGTGPHFHVGVKP